MAITEPTRPHEPTEVGRMKAVTWGTPFFMGLLLFALGILCFLAAGVTSLASIFFFGGILLAAGVVEIVYAFKRRRSGQFLVYFLAGLLSLVVGVLFLARPLAGLAAVTLLLAGYFFASGLFRGITSVMDRYAGWGWDLFSGAVSVLLGIILFAQWPLSSLWLLGVLVSVEFMVRGAMMMATGLALRRGLRTVTV